ncbi:acyl-CoA dehydrogenase family protein [Streptomyces sp. MB09-02B]|uniref:acyl-CoA dehydrogenase family protein n=1 Tax=Streptomyces sp. MB09-02B TaxID=3028667 RepID=UPI0029B1FDD7|nr:acyl-CoA dehydrogenase family protein [Streptomyces sp. MB09-02B]MDX3638818.1 acyl-CoA dehydrogenase family protein [Streptomyces sp. MB09-02B]
MPHLNPVDALDLDSQLDDDERLIRDTVAAFVRDRVTDHVAGWFESGTFPTDELTPEIGKLGLLGMHLEGYGCAGASAAAYGVACRELESADSGLRSFVSVQGSLVMFPIHRYGSEEQKQQWLPKLASGEAIGCFGLTEPDQGSDPGGMRTVAKRDGDDWVLNGTKMWITNGSIADIAVVWARTEEGIRGFLVPKDTPGFTTSEIHSKLSLRASVTAELHLEDVRLPADAVLPGVTGLRGPLSCLSEARFGILCGVVGAARTCYLSALDYSTTREQFGRPIGGFQFTQGKLARMQVDLVHAQLLALRLSKLKDAGQLRPEHVSLGKLANVRAALDIARSARTVLGANGITTEYPVLRHANNLETVLTYEGTEEIHALVVGESVTGLAAYR